MQKIDGTAEQLKKELAEARRRILELEASYRQAHSAFRLADEKYRDLFENTGESILIVDPSTNYIVDANANAARRLGYTLQELLKLRLDEIEVVSESKADSNDQSLSWESTFSGARFYECHYRRKDGSLVPVEVSSSLTVIDKRKVLQNFARDVSRRKEIETARKQAEQEREQLIHQLNAFAHTVAHDLKAPLSVIYGYYSLLEESLVNYPDPSIQNMIQSIGYSSWKMGKIIDELFIFASTRQLEEVATGPLSMIVIVNEAISRFKFKIAEDHAEIVLVDSEDWPVATGYDPWVEEVWTNYISNALKYGGSPPHIELGATLEPGGKMVRFWVRDNGQGIPLERQSELFKMYNRLNQTRIEGHGLGLSIVEKIVNKLGGQVGVESMPGQGSTFSFTLPKSDQNSES